MTGLLGRLRSARAVLAISCLLLIALPLFLLGFSYAYEATIVWKMRRDLRALIAQARPIFDAATAAQGSPDLQTMLDALGREQRALVYLLDGDGSVRRRSASGLDALDASYLGRLSERLLGGLWAAQQTLDLADLDRELEPIATRAEVQRALSGSTTAALRQSSSGQAVLVHVAAPLSRGSAIHVARGSRRGLRQLFLVRHELLKLVLYQSVFALLLGMFLSRHLLHPLERMARAARRYPKEPLGDAHLLSRRDELGELARAIAALTDALETRRRTTAELGADVAHEFKNPLSTIAASAELLAKSAADASSERASMISEHIQEAVARLRRSLDSLLSLLRLEERLQDEPRERVVYAELLQDILSDYRRDPRYADVTLTLDCPPAVGDVAMVALRWEELLRNLLDNALLQPTNRREIVVRATRDGDTVTTCVRDFGPGVSAGNRGKIFRRFFSQRPSGAPPGTGLGLSIVQAVATAHGGHVTVRDPDDGPGALFVVTLHDPTQRADSPDPQRD